MRKRLGTAIDDRLLGQARGMAQRQHTTLAGVFERALAEYMARHAAASLGPSSVAVSFGALALARAQVIRLEQENPFETE